MKNEMDDSYFNKIDARRNALVYAGNLIYQEVYRFVVAKVAPEEVKEIKAIYSSLLGTLKLFESVYEPEHNEDMALLALDMIVLGADFDRFIKEMKESITDRHFADIEFHWSMGGEGTEEQREQSKNTYQETLNALVNVYRQHSEFQTTINHRYQPRLIVCEQDYEAALDYFHNERYLVKEVVQNEYDDDNECDAENTRKFVSYQRPFQTFRTYSKRRFLSVDYIFDEHTVPHDTISKRIALGERFTVNCGDETEYSSLIELDMLHPQEQCQISSTLKFDVDLSSPMSARELEQTVARFRNEICNVQHSNRHASMFLASTFKELSDAYLQPKLEHVPISELMEIFSVGLTGKLSFNKIKILLCGMMVYKARWLRPKQGKNILDFKHDISERLTQDYGRGFSVQNIERGYQEVKRLLKEQLAESDLQMD